MPARRQLAAQLRRGGQEVSERLRQIERACRRYAATSIDEALDMLANDQHRPKG